MTTDRSNSAAELNALLAKAKQHATNAKRHDAEETTARQMKIVEWARCADEIEAAIEAAKADGWKLTYAEIARYMAWEAPDSVGAIRRWRRRNPGNPEVITSGPWKDGRSSDQRSAAVRHSNALKVALEEPEVLAERVAKDRSAACLLIRELQKHLKDSRRQPPEETFVPPVDPQPVLRDQDCVRLGDHALVVGDARTPYTKLQLASATGLPFLKEFFDRNAIEDSDGSGELDIVVISDPPYGQNKRGIKNDHIANWAAVYQLFRPRGGFVFCALRPKIFWAAEKGITDADGVPVHYLVWDKYAGRPLQGRLQNRLDAVIYFERGGHEPWQAGRSAVSLLDKHPARVARAELDELGGDHATPKPVGLMMDLIELVTKPGDIVLDPFAGSGSTLIACELTGRRFIGVDILPTNVDFAVRRWQRLTGKHAIVEVTFDRDKAKFSDLERDPHCADTEPVDLDRY